MFKCYYLAYGSNLNLNQMMERCPSFRIIDSLELDGYRLAYKGSNDFYSYLTIEKCEGSKVPLGLYELSIFDVAALDRYEGYPTFYSKEYIDVVVNGKVKKALIYVMNNYFGYRIPSREYVDTCMQGYDDFGFDKEILNNALELSINNHPKKLRK